MNDEQIEECWLEAEREADAPESEWLLYGQKVAAKAHAEMQELLLALRARIAELEQENFTLAAGACVVDGGLVGGEGGSPVCTLRERAQQWQPIETAPKDGRVICAFSSAWGDQWPCCAVAWRDGGWRFVHVPMIAMPQYWMPLPEAPKP